MIFRLTIRNLRANARRFTMTTLGVVLAVSFVVSAFVLGDGLRQTFGNLSTDIVAGTDLEVRPVEAFGSSRSLDDTDVDAVLAVDGVAAAVGLVEAPENSVRPITPAGEEIPTAGPPQLAFAWTDAPGFSPFTLVDGTPPAPGEFLMDLASADRHGFDVGGTYTVVSGTGRHELTLSGLTRFGDDNQTLGATLMSMHSSQTDEIFGTVGYDSIAISLTDAARADTDEAAQRVAASVVDVDVLDQATLTDETAAEFNTQIDLIQNILLGFAAVSLLVSTFIIGNTFAIVLQQRTREMGLLRLVGADASQLRRSALGEATLIGVLASAIGIPGGIGVAAGLTALVDAIGLTLPAYDIIVSTRTLIVAAVIGIGVTLASAWWPTRKATSVPALAALRSGTAGERGVSTRRTLAGTLLGAAAVAVAALGVFSGASTMATVVLMALGAVAMFVAVTLVGPRLVAPVSAGFAIVLDRLGMSGRLAVRNARRQAGRTSTTAAALMIGLAVVSKALVVGESTKAQLADDLDSALTADWLLTDQASDAGFPTAVAAEIAADPAFGAVTGVRVADARIDTADALGDSGDVAEFAAIDFGAAPELLALDVVEGSLPAGATNDQVLISRDLATAEAFSVGDRIAATLENGAPASLTIAGVFAEDSVIGQDWLVDTAVFDDLGLAATDTFVAFNTAAGLDDAAAAQAVAAIEQRYPQGELESAGEFRERMEGLIDQILSVLNVLVALAVVIALIGIANTLALSVSERTREIGLVRAVGMTERGVRRMVRYESAVIAGFGAVLGVIMGIGLGWLTVEALPASFVDTLAIPTGQIMVLVVVAAVAGLGAALLPARRAGRMPVLAAIGG